MLSPAGYACHASPVQVKQEPSLDTKHSFGLQTGFKGLKQKGGTPLSACGKWPRQVLTALQGDLGSRPPGCHVAQLSVSMLDWMTEERLRLCSSFQVTVQCWSDHVAVQILWRREITMRWHINGLNMSIRVKLLAKISDYDFRFLLLLGFRFLLKTIIWVLTFFPLRIPALIVQFWLFFLEFWLFPQSSPFFSRFFFPLRIQFLSQNSFSQNSEIKVKIHRKKNSEKTKCGSHRPPH